jgi:hypothetical protein
MEIGPPPGNPHGCLVVRDTLSASTAYKAALDAQSLADEILAAGHDLDVALPRYEAARSLFGRRAVACALARRAPRGPV